jgi:hypothetical protein
MMLMMGFTAEHFPGRYCQFLFLAGFAVVACDYGWVARREVVEDLHYEVIIA